MKFTKPTILTAVAVVVLTTGGVVAAQMGDTRVVPAGPPVKIQWAEPVVQEPVVNPTVPETPITDTPDNTSTPEPTATPAPVAPPTQTPSNEVAPNVTPAPNPPAEIDLTPEPLPAPDVCQTCVSNETGNTEGSSSNQNR